MQIALHMGAHCTDDSMFLRVLLHNRARLIEQGIAVPHPDHYQSLLRSVAAVRAGQAAPEPATLEAGLLQGWQGAAPKRLVMSFDGFLAIQRDAVMGEQLYPKGEERLAALGKIFPAQRLELFLSLRNPATWLATLTERQRAKGQEGQAAPTHTPEALRWSELILRLKQVAPQVQLTVWADEDSPILAPRLLRLMSGHAPEMTLDHALNLPVQLMEPAGAKRLAGWMRDARPETDAERELGLAKFLSHFARPEALEMDIDMPDWDEARIARLTEGYERDLEAIAAMAGVTFLRPAL